MARSEQQSFALVTGGARRIGRAICLKLSRLGYGIAIQYHESREEAEQLKEEIDRNGGTAATFQCNLLDAVQTRQLIPRVAEHYPGFNLLVNNASLFRKDTLQQADLAQYEDHHRIHSQAPFILTQEFARHGRKGQIINLLDTHVTGRQTDHFTYLLSKKNLLALTEMAALALAPDIRVNGIAPGLILPPEDESDGYLQRLAKDIPLKRRGHVENIEQSVGFLVENDFLTGQVIYNDGGEHLL